MGETSARPKRFMTQPPTKKYIFNIRCKTYFQHSRGTIFGRGKKLPLTSTCKTKNNNVRVEIPCCGQAIRCAQQFLAKVACDPAKIHFCTNSLFTQSNFHRSRFSVLHPRESTMFFYLLISALLHLGYANRTVGLSKEDNGQ